MTKDSQLRRSRHWLVGGGEMGDLVRAFDWSTTALGPIQSWPQSLRTAVSLCLSSTFPMNIIWGPGSIQIYNDGYRLCCGDAHPRALGEDYRVTWASAWPAIGESFARAWAGERKFLENQRMFLKRLNGQLEETFFTFSHSPIQDESGQVGGLFHPVTETTATMLAERRTRALRDLAANLAAATDELDVARRTRGVLAQFEFDLPFLLYYVFDPRSTRYELVAHHGIAPDTPQAPSSVAPDSTEPWPFAKALAVSGIIEVDDLPSSILKGVSCGPYEEPPNTGFVIPIVVPAAEQTPAVIVTGASSRLPLNAHYRSFHDLLGFTIAVALANARAREDERRRAEALAEIDRAKTAFFSNVSHEFRTPLTLMLGPLEELKRELGGGVGSVSETQYRQIDLAHRNALRLLKLVNTLLDFSRIEAGRVQAAYEPTDLAATTAELASVFRSAIEKAGLRLVVDCAPLSEAAYVDREMWEKIVLNLLSNALKFTFEGEIEVRLRQMHEHFALSVHDTGVGIPERELPKLFDRFHRVEGAHGRTHEGSGIGLALVQELVKLHGGTVSVESGHGKGSTFTVVIPRGSSHLPAERIGAARNVASTALGASHFVEEALRWLPGTGATEDGTFADSIPHASEALSGERPHVLLADDNADMRDYVRRLLASRYEVDVVSDGEAALAAIARRKPDLLLADIMMPRLDGMQLLARLRAGQDTSTLPVILLSARAGEESRVEGMRSGADDYLIKPFSARELLARVEAHVKMARFRNEAADALRASEERYRAFVTASSDVVYRMSPDWSEMRYLRGKDFIADTESPSRSWLQKYIRPDDQSRVRAAIHEAISGKSVFELEHPVIRVDGTMGWTHSRALPVLDAGGEIIEWFGAARDITERREWEDRQRVLVAELQHRTRNLVGVVRSMADKTIAHSTDFADFRARYLDRLGALARVQSLLSRLAEGERITFDDLIRNELAALDGGAKKVTLQGPRGVRLRSSTVQTFALALHELATNAVKYGAFSQPRGQLAVNWRLDHASDGRPWLHVDWRERGVAMPDKDESPQGGGSGRDLIERALPYQLGARTTYDMEADGVHCTISLPVSGGKAHGDEIHV